MSELEAGPNVTPQEANTETPPTGMVEVEIVAGTEPEATAPAVPVPVVAQVLAESAPEPISEPAPVSEPSFNEDAFRKDWLNRFEQNRASPFGTYQELLDEAIFHARANRAATTRERARVRKIAESHRPGGGPGVKAFDAFMAQAFVDGRKARKGQKPDQPKRRRGRPPKKK